MTEVTAPWPSNVSISWFGNQDPSTSACLRSSFSIPELKRSRSRSDNRSVEGVSSLTAATGCPTVHAEAASDRACRSMLVGTCRRNSPRGLCQNCVTCPPKPWGKYVNTGSRA